MYTETIDLTSESAASDDRGAEPCPPLTRLEERVHDSGSSPIPPVVFPFETEPESPSLSEDPPGHWDRIFHGHLYVHQPAPVSDPADLPEPVPFRTRIFEVARMLTAMGDPVAVWLAFRVAQLGVTAEYLSATTPDEFDAREAEQERWLAERNGGAR